MILEKIRLLLDKLEEENIHNLLDTVCIIDECHRIDEMMASAFREEGIDIKAFQMEEEIEEMILADMEHWKRVFEELEGTLMDMEYEEHYRRFEDYL